MKIFNASGHPIEQGGVVEIVGEAKIPNVDRADAGAVLALAQEIADLAAPHVRAGAFLALPGASALAAHVLACAHGLCGHWPRIAWSARIDGVFAWSEAQVADLHDVRTAQRERGRV